MLAPTADSDKTDTEGRLPRCEDEVALSRLGVTVPQVMKSPLAADHHGVPFSLIYVILHHQVCMVDFGCRS